MTNSPFDHERDAELGALLRAHLDGDQHAAFVARVRTALQADLGAGPIDILGAWMRPGIAAAAIVAVAAGWYLSAGARTEVASTTPVEVLAAGGGADVMLATALEAK
jgi:hypothetical protein